jgi:hypothetical protein
LIALASVALIACGDSPDEREQEAAQAPAPAQDTELLDSTQATLDRARAVQDTVDEHASKLDAETREAMGETAAPDADPNEDPNSRTKDD